MTKAANKDNRNKFSLGPNDDVFGSGSRPEGVNRYGYDHSPRVPRADNPGV